MLLPLLLAATPLIGYGISAQVPDELPIGKKWFFTGSLLLSMPLFWLVPWWIALIATAGIAIGWFPGLFGLLVLLMLPADWTLSCLVATLGVLIGTRWRTDKRPIRQLILGSAALALGALLLPQLI